MSKKEVQLGDLVKDRVSGFKGIVIAITRWLNGCDRVCVQPQKMKGGKIAENETIDAMQLEVLKSTDLSVSHDTGGPRPSAKAMPRTSR